jgi:hypothetical protein
LLPTLPIGVEQPGPHIACGAQQPEATVSLPVGGSQPDPGSPVNQARIGDICMHLERMFVPVHLPVKARERNCGRSFGRPTPLAASSGLPEAWLRR